MKQLSALLLVFFGFVCHAQIVNIPDANFKAKLLQASSSNQIASSETPVYNEVNNTWSVSSYNTVDTNGDGEIQVSEAQAIKWLITYSSTIYDATGIEAFTNLHYLHLSNNQLSNLNVSGLTNLKFLNCSFNQLTNLSITGLDNLLILNCSHNLLTNLNVFNLFNLQKLDCTYNQVTNLDVSGLNNLQNLNCSHNQLINLNVSGLPNLNYLICYDNQLTSLNLSGLPNLRYLDNSSNQFSSSDFSGLTNLQYLYCSYNQLTNLTISGLTNLKYLYCSNNQLTQLNFLGLNNLHDLSCQYNEFSSLDVSALTNLQFLDCSSNQLTSLGITGLTHLNSLYCYNNLLTSLNFSGLNNLYYLNCGNNYINNLDVSSLVNLYDLNCSHNQLTSLDISGLANLLYLYCSSNDLTHLILKNNNSSWNYLFFGSNPNLAYICADEEDIEIVQLNVDTYGYSSTCQVNSYCNFTPGGTYYTIKGSNRFDSNGNGCDNNDVAYTNLKFNITNNTQSGSLITNASGSYTLPVSAGTHTYTPVLENSDYFSVSPTTVTVDFPTQTSPFTQDFCITTNGIHHDLEVTVIPLGVARPGFDATYKLIYKNKGNQLENPVLTYAFNDDVMDFLTASVVPSNQSSGLLSWNLTPLAPLQSGTIEVSFNLNSPTETPALNAGDVLNFVSAINGLNTDEMPNDNTFGFPQTVVNSLDPNDKTCLEGNTINPSLIGQYVHYMIRFENTGTYPAQNIVVKDIIDTTKFDSTTLQMVNSSHACYTRINGNKVEFIFENINLPFDDATNDGYVVFKIKTKSNLTVGATISNSASIYFDYNFPIVTNTATSTFQLLNTSDFEFENEFVLYPIPTSNSLSVTSKNNLEITSVAIYNELGQLVQTETNPGLSFDVSGLKTGVYVVKVTSEKGTSFSQFIKN